MQRFGAILFLTLLACLRPGPAAAQDSNELADMQWQAPVVTNVDNAPTFWFPVGEKLTYSVHWGMFQVATAEVTTDWVRWRDGRLLLRIRYKTASNRIVASLYPVNDLIDSYIDPTNFLPVRFMKNMSEGKRRELAVTDFNHTAGTARWRKKVRNYGDWVLPIEPGLRDIPSLSYWIRKEGFQDGTTRTNKVMADDKIYSLSLATVDKNETIPIPDLGLVPALRITPEAAFEGLFVRTGQITAWVSRGSPCLLLRMDAEVPVAKIRIRLVKIEGPDSDKWKNLWPTVKK